MSVKLLRQLRKTVVGPGWVLEGERKHKVGADRRKAVLYVLCDHADDDGHCRLSQYTIASEAEIPYGSLRRVLRSLEGDGIVERRQRNGRRGYRVADEIRVLLPTGERPTAHSCGQALEAPLRSVTTSRCDERTDRKGEKKMPVRDTSTYEQDSGCLPQERPRTGPSTKEKKASTKPDTAMALAYRLKKKAKRIQPHVVDPVKVERLAGVIARWKRDPDNPVTPEEVRVAQDICCEEFYGQAPDAPIGAIFVKQAPRWIEAARERIYREQTLPKLQRQHSRLWRHVHEDFARWMEENSDATRDQQHVMKRALYEAWKKELGVE